LNFRSNNTCQKPTKPHYGTTDDRKGVVPLLLKPINSIFNYNTMDRIIKFKCFYEGKWHYFTIGQSMTDMQRAVYDQCCLLGLPFLQFTGLLDKNKTEIFEEDIIKFFNPGSKDHEIHLIEWNNRNADFGIDGRDAGLSEVIGTFFENPELINP
jgi:hypothetical protein